METKHKRQLTAWAKFCKENYAQNKSEFNNSYRDMLKSPELKNAYAASKNEKAGDKISRRSIKSRNSG